MMLPLAGAEAGAHRSYPAAAPMLLQLMQRPAADTVSPAMIPASQPAPAPMSVLDQSRVASPT